MKFKVILFDDFDNSIKQIGVYDDIKVAIGISNNYSSGFTSGLNKFNIVDKEYYMVQDGFKNIISNGGNKKYTVEILPID
jgi:hypothetical protein